jgi:hypothetical protein
MPATSYSNRQIEAANLLRSTEREEVSSEVIDEIVTMIGEAEKGKLKLPSQEDETEINIKMKLLNETDWRKRAALSAMIISNSLK